MWGDSTGERNGHGHKFAGTYSLDAYMPYRGICLAPTDDTVNIRTDGGYHYARPWNWINQHPITNPQTGHAGLRRPVQPTIPETTVTNSPLTASGTTLTLAGGFAQTNGFSVLQIEDELVLVTAGSGTASQTITRGYDSTLAVAHVAGTPVRIANWNSERSFSIPSAPITVAMTGGVTATVTAAAGSFPTSTWGTTGNINIDGEALAFTANTGTVLTLSAACAANHAIGAQCGLRKFPNGNAAIILEPTWKGPINGNLKFSVFWEATNLGTNTASSGSINIQPYVLSYDEVSNYALGSSIASGTSIATQTADATGTLKDTNVNIPAATHAVSSVASGIALFINNNNYPTGPATVHRTGAFAYGTPWGYVEGAHTSQGARALSELILSCKSTTGYDAGQIKRYQCMLRYGASSRGGSGSSVVWERLCFGFNELPAGESAFVDPVNLPWSVLASTTLSTAFTDTTSVGSFTVGDTTGWPSNGHVLIDNERLHYSSKTATTIVVDQRGYASTAATHTAGTTVYVGYPNNHSEGMATNFYFWDLYRRDLFNQAAVLEGLSSTSANTLFFHDYVVPPRVHDTPNYTTGANGTNGASAPLTSTATEADWAARQARLLLFRNSIISHRTNPSRQGVIDLYTNGLTYAERIAAGYIDDPASRLHDSAAGYARAYAMAYAAEITGAKTITNIAGVTVTKSKSNFLGIGGAF